MTRAIARGASPRPHTSAVNPVAVVLLPFAAGYFLSHFFRVINALLAETLTTEFGLDPAELGFITSAYFACLALSQLPLGVLLDRFGPRLVQCVSLLVACAGALWFALARSMVDLAAGRILIGFGVAAAFVSGLKAIVLWLPAERRAASNGLFVALGALGAVSATAPAELALAAIGWRGLFLALAWLACSVAVITWLVVPDQSSTRKVASAGNNVGFREILADHRFWALAPLSASTIGTAWALQGLWAAPWLSTVEGLSHPAIVTHLLVIAIVLSASGILLGAATDRARRHGIPIEVLLGLVAVLSLILRSPVPTYVAWAMISAAGAATVLSYAILPGLFPTSASGRATGALNLLHLGTAFVVQWLTGVVIDLAADGGDPAAAYRIAFTVNLAGQIAALGWFTLQGRRPITRRGRRAVPTVLTAYHRESVPSPYQQARSDWQRRLQEARTQHADWRAAAIGSAALSIALLKLVLPH